jgi:phage major head subunit gpT-like protein
MYKDWVQFYKQLFFVANSTKAYEEEHRVVGFGAAQETAELEDAHLEDTQQSYTIQYNHVKYSLGYRISKEMIDDDQYAITKKFTQKLSQSMMRTVDLLAGTQYAAAFTTARYDGQALCSNSHPLVSGGTCDNLLAAALDALTLEQALELMARFKSDEGWPIYVRANTLVIPPELEATASRLLQSMGYPSLDLAAAPTAAFTPNDVNYLKGKFTAPVVCPYLSDTNDWFVRAQTGEEDGLKMFWRMMPDLEFEENISNRSTLVTSMMRLCFGVSDWRNIVGSSVT